MGGIPGLMGETLSPESQTHRETRVEVTLSATLSTLLAGLASVFLLAAITLGMWHGEIRIDPESHRLADQVNRAGNIAAACFFTAEVIAGWLLMRSGLASLFNLH